MRRASSWRDGTVCGYAPDVAKYQVPSPQIVATFDAPPLPNVIVSPTRQMLAQTMRKGSPTLAELARPTLRLAGVRVDPKNNGPHRTATNGGGLPSRSSGSATAASLRDRPAAGKRLERALFS